MPDLDPTHTLAVDGSELGSKILETGVSHKLTDTDGDGLTEGVDITITIKSRLNGNISGAITTKMKDSYIFPPISHVIEDAFPPGESNYTMHVSLRDLQLQLYSGTIAVGSVASFEMDYGVPDRLFKYFDIIYDPDLLDDLGARFEKVDIMPLGNPINALNVSTTVEMLTAGKLNLTYNAELDTGGDLLEWTFSSLRDFGPGFHTISEIFAVPTLVKSDGVFSLNITGRFTYPTGEVFVFDVMGYKANITVSDTSDPTSEPTEVTDSTTSTTTSNVESSTEQSTPTAPVPFWFSIIPIIIPVAIKKRKNRN